MHAFLSALRRVPFWAYLLVLLVLTVNTIYLIFRHQVANDGTGSKIENGHCIITRVQPGSPADKAGLQTGDILVSIDSVKITHYPHLSYLLYLCKTGDQLTYVISRNNREFSVQVILRSILWEVPGFFQTMYALILLVSVTSLYLLVKKPDDPSATLFFIFIQFFSITENGRMFLLSDPVATFVSSVWMLSGCLFGPALIHFHLHFPRPAAFFLRYKKLPWICYSTGLLVFVFYALSYILNIYGTDSGFYNSAYLLFDSLAVIWMTLTFTIALFIVIYQYFTIKSTLPRNQLRLVIIGSFFGFITPMTIVFFGTFVSKMYDTYPIFVDFFHGIGSLIMVLFILIAIFRYRIWDMEIIIKRALLYLGATATIILSYLFMIWFVDRFISSETNVIRFVVLAVSVVLFLVLRDRIQRLIDRLFYRETYDSATVVSDFEAKLAGIYRIDELKEKIFRGLDDIFHFSFFTFHLKKENLIYEPAFVYGTTQPATGSEVEINREFEERLQKTNVFSPEELNEKPSILEEANGELVVPLVSDDRANGFFICGQKKSERIYSRQDIQVLGLLAQRVVSLLHTAGLYQKDLDRQLMLERERARISQDMHDDVGASLTRISILSELAKNRAETDRETKQWLEQITTTSHGVMEEMSQIIWALNPKNDTLEGLIAYIRRFANEYLEPTSIHCTFELPEILPDIPLSVEVRRNIYLVVREALHNAVKHSGATHVSISLIMNEHGFNIIIKDDGLGFDPDKLEFPGNGLVNMKKRIKDVGGDFRINSESGEGTLIELGVPLK